ncbi:MAG: FKBP-type peptidyl-prolyl cis-trans isomerase [Bacteroidales bacterium]|jgi:FKBP-type peptidyl-prolyl cis-trans isomerase FkpA|nr:FKBP-type peptidyl-prolyl cis-trans isomerase [Bacteroidales bacterium]
MKNVIIFLMVSLLIFAACGDEDIPKSYEEQLAIDIEKIENYLLDSNLTAESTASGLHYIIEEQGTGSHPSVDSTVEVTYTGTFLDGELFDEGTIEVELSALVLGWQEGLPFFKEGGKGLLFVPSALGYGINGYYNIPGSSVLIFDIELVDVSD